MSKIIPANGSASEGELAQALVLFLETQPYGEADYPAIRFNLPRYIELSDEDREVSRSRDAEMKWQTKVRNLAAHGSFTHLVVKRRGGGYQLASRVKR